MFDNALEIQLRDSSFLTQNLKEIFQCVFGKSISNFFPMHPNMLINEENEVKRATLT